MAQDGLTALDPRPHPGLASAAWVWLVRHPEVSAEWRGRAYGDLDVPLSEEGRSDVARLAGRFAARQPAEVLTSPLARARTLAEAVAAESGAPLVVEDALREIHRGSWQGRPVDEIPPEEVAAFYADPWTFDAHGGESDARVLARAWPVLEAAVRRRPGGELVLVAHYNVIRVLVARALGIAPPDSFALRVDPGRAVLLHDAPAGEALAGRPRSEAPPVAGWVLHRSNVGSPA